LRPRFAVSAVRVLCLSLSIAFIVGACGAPAGDEGQMEATSWQTLLGEEMYMGDMVALSYETDEEQVTGVRHREVLDLGEFVGKTLVPIVLVFYDPLAEHAPSVIMQMERLSEQAGEAAAILLITPDAEDDFLTMFNHEWLPMFVMVKDGAALDEIVGLDDQTIARLNEFIGSE
jgi:hypothetical protein